MINYANTNPLSNELKSVPKQLKNLRTVPCRLLKTKVTTKMYVKHLPLITENFLVDFAVE